MTVRALTLLIVMSAVWAGPSLAQDRGSQSDQDACTPDVFRLCQQFIPDEDPIVACLKSKRDNLSPACRHVFFSDPPPAQPPTDDKTNAATSDGATETDDGAHPRQVHHKHHKTHRLGDGRTVPRRHHNHHHQSNQT